MPKYPPNNQNQLQNAHPLIQLGQEFSRTIGEESIPFEAYLEELKEDISNELSGD